MHNTYLLQVALCVQNTLCLQYMYTAHFVSNTCTQHTLFTIRLHNTFCSQI